MTAIAATAQPGTALAPASVLVEVTGAPNPPAAVYTADFSAGVDSWTGSPVQGNDPGPPARLLLATTTGSRTTEEATRTINGLTIGQDYEVRVWAAQEYGSLGVKVKTSPSTVIATLPATAGTGWRSLVFTAAAISQDLVLPVTPEFTNAWQGGYQVETVTVKPVSGWIGTHIYRTDVNGTREVRQDPGGNDVAGGTLTLTDYEAAVSGELSYTVVDGTGTQATVPADQLLAPGAWLTAPATAFPSTPTPPTFVGVDLVLSYDEAADTNGSLHTIISRSDPVANPGPMSLRTGAMDIWCADYATVRAVRDLMATGEIAMLRQPDHAGMDLYFYPRTFASRPDAAETATRRWVVTVGYVEVAAP